MRIGRSGSGRRGRGRRRPRGDTPLHRQLSTVLRASITDGRLPAGSQLATEAELQEKFGISRSVVRQALLTLTAEGLILRGRGRGSVVAPQRAHHRLVQRMSGLSTQLPRVQTEVLSITPERNALAEATLAAPQVLEIRRLRSADSDPIALIETWLPLHLAETLTAAELTDASLHATLRRRFGIAIVSGRRHMRAVAATPTLASALRVPEASPLLLLEGTSFDSAGAPIEVFRTWHRADRVIFDLDVVHDFGLESPAEASVLAMVTAVPSVPAAATPKLAAQAERIRHLARELEQLSEDLDRQ